MQAYRLIQYERLYIDRQLLGVAGVCFVAPIYHTNLFVWYIVLVDNFMGFIPLKITYRSVVGCYPQHWMYAVSFFAQVTLSVILTWAGFALSRKGHLEKNVTWLLAGALFLYPIANRLVWFVVGLLEGRNQLWFMARKADFVQKPVPLFGNFYNFRFSQFCINTVLSIALYALAYWVISHYWNSRFRWQMLTVGAIACVGGWFFWHLFLGRLLY